MVDFDQDRFAACVVENWPQEFEQLVAGEAVAGAAVGVLM